MSALVVSTDAVVDQLQSLKLVVEELRREVCDLLAENLVLRQENADLRQQVRDLTREVGYWKSRHADVKNKNVLVQAELDQVKAETRQLKAERFGKTLEKQKKVDRSNDLAAPPRIPLIPKIQAQSERSEVSNPIALLRNEETVLTCPFASKSSTCQTKKKSAAAAVCR